MDFELTDEQQMLKDSARRYLENHCAFEQHKAVIAQGSFDAGHWATYAEFGWLGMGLPETVDGLGASPVETAILMEEMGRVLFIEPYWAVAVLAAQTIVATGPGAKAHALLSALASGASRPVLAHGESAARGRIEHVATRAQVLPEGAGWQLDGNKSLVVGGNIADCFIISARTGGASSDQHGISLFMVARNTPGLMISNVRLIDNRWCADLDLAGVIVGPADVLGEIDGAYFALDTGHAHALAALCAEAVGVMDKALWITRDYLKMRKQFGVALSTFQSLQHRMSEMLIEVELARSMLYCALGAMDAEPAARMRLLSAAKVQIGHSGKFVCGQAIQLHGGIGVTEEYVIGHHFKRMTSIEYALGNSHIHLERLAEFERNATA